MFRKKVKTFLTQVWDTTGHQLYSSNVGDNPVTAISWSYSSDNYFAVGSFNTIKLCDRNGVRLILLHIRIHNC